MKIEFADVKAAELFNTEKKLRGHYGAELAGGYKGCVACRLSGNWRLIFKPAPPAPPRPFCI
jgi:mRNA-degrading endonuclease YafQ of YafQ-DinJ toxin-antitoxin module